MTRREDVMVPLLHDKTGRLPEQALLFTRTNEG
jgi:hypothetical protein